MPGNVFLINREISWLSFNERVLQEAEDPNVPLLERLRFLGIYSNNLDEFYRVRVANIRRIMKHGKRGKEFLGESPSSLYDRLQQIILRQQAKFESIYRKILKELEKHGTFIVNEKQLSKEQGEFVRSYFNEQVMPALFPIMLDNAPEFPYLKDRAIYLVIKITSYDREKKYRYALIEIPGNLKRFTLLPSAGSKKQIIFLDDIIRYCLGEVFSFGDYDSIEAYTIKMTRDAELDIDHDLSKSFVEKISRSLKKRSKGAPVRFIFDTAMSKDVMLYLRKRLSVLKNEYLVPGSRYHNLKDLINFPDTGTSELKYQPSLPIEHESLKRQKSIFRVLKEQDILLTYPYQSFNHIIDFLREASMDPKVVSIQMTLYRAGRNSNIVNALVNALRNGKKVTVVMELQARFDEEANIFWANKLQEEGVNVIYGVPGLKVHSKLILVTRKEKGKTNRYAHIGTGNFNEDTSKIYSDFSLITSDKRITREILEVFKHYRDNQHKPEFKHLLVAPFNMRKRLNRLINTEIDNALSGQTAEIILKMNSIVDSQLIRKLYEASRAGVKVRIIVRGICSLVTGILDQSENIRAISIVDKFLEHGRVFVFHNSGREKYFISSADWMTRNLDYRSEVAVPVYDKDICKVLKRILEIQWADNTKARVINTLQDNKYQTNDLGVRVRAQEDIYRYLSRKMTGIKQKGKELEVRSH